MTRTRCLSIFGASTRAAASSAMRAGLAPWCIDLFADRDLSSWCPITRVSGVRYPVGILDLQASAPAGPWMYTGGLENRPGLIAKLAAQRALWGNSGAALRRARDPFFLQSLLAHAGMTCPKISRPGHVDRSCQWLLKPTRGAGGTRIRVWDYQVFVPGSPGTFYCQELIEGIPCSGVYIAHQAEIQFLAASRQLIGQSWLRARPFQYCGSIGPMNLAPLTKDAFIRLGSAVGRGCGLRGIFGIDCVLRDDLPLPVEVNPRYTASVEVLEYAYGISVLALHQAVFEPEGRSSLARSDWDFPPVDQQFTIGPVFGKAILFAKQRMTMPEHGPWDDSVKSDRPWSLMPRFADIPPAGETIAQGQPILTLFARGGSAAKCEQELREASADLERWLFHG